MWKAFPPVFIIKNKIQKPLAGLTQKETHQVPMQPPL